MSYSSRYSGSSEVFFGTCVGPATGVVQWYPAGSYIPDVKLPDRRRKRLLLLTNKGGLK